MSNLYNDVVSTFNTADGGEGSGHFNHLGIPNHWGGSARSGVREKYYNVEREEHREGSHKNYVNMHDDFPYISYEKAQAYTEAINNYSGSSYGYIRGTYPGNYNHNSFKKNSDNKKYISEAHSIDDFIYEIPKYNGEVYRGIAVDKEAADNIINNLKKGKKMDMSGISSWSSGRSIAEDFADHNVGDEGVSIIFVVDNKSGASIRDYSEFPHEDEVLLPSTARYKLDTDNPIEENEYGGKYTVVHLVEVDYESKR